MFKHYTLEVTTINGEPKAELHRTPSDLNYWEQKYGREVDMLKYRLVHLTEENHGLEELVNQLQNEIKSMQEERSAILAESYDYKEKCEKWKQEYTRLNGIFNKQTPEILNEVREWKGKYYTAEETIKSYEAVRDALIKKNMELEKDNEALRTTVAEYDNKYKGNAFVEEFDRMLEAERALTKKVEELEEKLGVSEATNKMFVDGSKERDKVITNLKQAVDILERDKRDLLKEKWAKVRDNNDLKKDIKVHKRAIDGWRAKYEDIVKASKESADKADEHIAEVERHRDELILQNMDLKQKIDNLMYLDGARVRFAKEVDRLTDENRKLKDTIQVLRALPN